MRRYTFKILITYSSIGDIGLPVMAQVVIDSMTNNARFPNPPTPLADVQKAKDEYERSLAQAQLGDERAIAEKNLLRKRLEDLLRELAGYVLGIAKNDPEVLASSGFDISTPPVGRTRDTFTVLNGKAIGEVISTVNGVKNARVYYHQCTPDPVTPESTWTERTGPDRRYVHTGLEQYVKYWFRVRIVTDEGPEIFTDAVMRMVL